MLCSSAFSKNLLSYNWKVLSFGLFWFHQQWVEALLSRTAYCKILVAINFHYGNSTQGSSYNSDKLHKPTCMPTDCNISQNSTLDSHRQYLCDPHHGNTKWPRIFNTFCLYFVKHSIIFSLQMKQWNLWCC